MAQTRVIAKGIDEFLVGIHDAFEFVRRFFRELFKPPFHFREIINQTFEIGAKSLALISVTGYFRKKAAGKSP